MACVVYSSHPEVMLLPIYLSIYLSCVLRNLLFLVFPIFGDVFSLLVVGGGVGD